MTDCPPAPEPPPGPSPSPGLLALGFPTADSGFTAPDEAAAAAMSQEPGVGVGETIGRYELIEPLGEGGFGVVWRARQHQPIQRETALKLIRNGLGGRAVVARFEAERQALAMMDHPNIAAVLDAGAAADGRPYFVMELVSGIPVTDYGDAKNLSLRERLALFIPVCQAVQHAHQKAVLHRDLKPSNILVTEIDGQAVPKVIDFGVAKALGPEAGPLTPGGPARTAIGTVVGTPPYMSPEQAGCGLDVDTRSDVYSLGVILFTLLTGHTPEPPPGVDFAAALRWVREAEPVRPSALVLSLKAPEAESAARRRRLTAGRLARALKGDLDWITLKALSKDRARRYGTAAALARDLQRHLDRQTVSAAAPSLSYRMGKFSRRHRAGLVAAGLITVALAGGTGVSLWQAARADKNRREAEINYGRARGAVEVFLSRVTEHPLFADGKFKDLRKELLETAVPFYEEISHRQSQDSGPPADRLRTLERLADLYRSIGESAKAEAIHQQALKLGGRKTGPPDPPPP
ncbi:MAG: serine/threonine-protein kinase [Verrucomicrobiota bacterium]